MVLTGTPHVPPRSPSINRLQPGRDAPVVDGISPVQTAARGSGDSAFAAGPGTMHGGLARREPRRYLAQPVWSGPCAMGCAAAAREYSRGGQHYLLLFAPATRAHSPVGQFPGPRADTH